jgi:large repetitive protein
MSTTDKAPRGTVVSIWGKAYIRGTDGVWRPLKLGEVVKAGDAILTEQDAIVQMEPTPPRPALTEVDQAVSALNRGAPDAAPAAGLAGGDGGDLQPGLRVDRIVETLNPAGLLTRLDSSPLASGIALAATAPEANDPARVLAASSTVAAIEQGGNVNLGLAPPSGGGNIVITVTQVPAIGAIVTTGGAAVGVGTPLSPAELVGLVYQPPADYDGTTPVGAFGYSASNGSSSANGSTQISLAAVNDAPVATAGSASGLEDGIVGVALGGTDVDGTIASVRVTSLPANGTLLLADGVTPVLANQALAPTQAAALMFIPMPNFHGSASLSFTVTDNSGAVSAPAAFALTIAPVNDFPVALDDSVSTVGVVPVTVAVLANDSDVDGDPLRLLGANVDPSLGSVVVNADNSVTFTAAPGVSGPVPIAYTAFDPSGFTASATLTVNVAGSPGVTVDAPALSNDSTPTIVGTSNLPPGSTVTLTVTDANGALQTFTTTVLADGTWSASVPAALPDGSYSVNASVTAPGGASASANDGGSVDTTAPAISVDAPALGNDATPTIVGTTDLPSGSTISLTVTGANGAVQTFTAVVQAGGVFSADVPAALAEGPFGVVAVGSDAAGNSASASDSGTVDMTPPTLSVDAPALTNDTTPPITGTTDLPAGATVTLTITDAAGTVQTLAATVVAGGTFSVDVPAPMAQGAFTVSAAAADAAGNSATANDSGTVDSIAPTLTVDAPALTNDTTPTITGTTNLPAGSTVTLTVTDFAGTVQTLTATVAAGGTYAVDVPAALAQGVFTVSAFAADAAGNSATANDSGAVDSIAPTLTVDAPTLTNDTTPTITGTTDLPAGSTVTLTVTDFAGTVQTISATVVPGGTYAVDVPTALAQGAFTVSASAADAAGNSASANDSGAVDAIPPAASITLDAVSGDDIVNAGEATGTVALTGSVGGDVQVGDSVTLTVNGIAYSGAVQAGGTFSINVVGADVLADADRTIDASVTTTDLAGNSSTATATRTYSVNNAPVAVADTANVSEDAANVSGDATPGTPGQDSDADGDALSVTGVAAGALPSASGNVGSGVAGTYGTLTLAASGNWTYVPNANAQTLGAGQSGSDVFTYTIDDGRGGSASATLTVSVQGSDDPTTITGTLAGAVQEDVTASAVGSLTAADPESGSVAFTPQAATAGVYGNFSITGGGAWIYTLANSSANVQALRVGESVSETFSVAAGSATASVTVTVTGTNDVPSVSAAAASATEGGSAVGGTLAGSDADSGETATLAYTLVGAAPAGFSLAADGVWSFDPTDAAYDGLVLGATQTITIPYTATDVDGAASAAANLVITLTGSNDTPVASAASRTVAEDAAVINGSVVATDVDSGETATLTYALTGAAPAGLTFNADGSYSFDASNAAYQSLGVGDSVVLTIPYRATDVHGAASNSADLTITVTGTNDAPLAVADSTTAVEAGGTNNNGSGTDPTGNVLDNDTDADSGDGKEVSALSFGAASGTMGSALSGSYGALTLNADGSYGYVLDNANTAVQALRAGDTLTEVFSYTVRDAAGATSSATLTVTIEGRNDAPTVGTASATVSEEGLAGANVDASGASDTTDSLSASGTIAIGDVDASPSYSVTLTAPVAALTSNGSPITWSGSGTGTLVGSVGSSTLVSATIDNSGAWTVTLSGPIDHASAGSEDLRSFGIGVAVSDGTATTTSTLTVNVEDDSPLWASATQNAQVEVGAGNSVTGNLNVALGADDGSSAKVTFSGGSVDASGYITTSYTSPAGGTVSSYLTYGGDRLKWVSQPDGSMVAETDGGAQVLQVTGNPTAGTYSVTELLRPDLTSYAATTFGSLSAGNNGVYTFSDSNAIFTINATATGTTGNPGTVNTNAGFFGVNNNFINTNELLTLSFANTMSGISFSTNALGSGETLTWAAYDGTTLVGSGTLAGAGTSPSLTLTDANFSGGQFTTIVLGAGSSTSYRAAITGVTGQTTLLDQTTTLSASVADADGDGTPASQSFTLTLSGDASMTASAVGDALAGGSAAETLNGGAGNDALYGNGGNDTLVGNGGADTLVGGAGDDNLTGGTGADVFAWRLGDTGSDTLVGFDAAAAASGGDVLDLRDLLQGETTQASLDGHLNFSIVSGNTVIAVKPAGAAGSADQTITLTGVTLDTALGLASGASDAAIIAELINRGKLLTDVPG